MFLIYKDFTAHTTIGRLPHVFIKNGMGCKKQKWTRTAKVLVNISKCELND